MSLIKRLQKKISSVTHDLNERFAPQPKTEELPYDPIVASCFHGASQLLENYQNVWSMIHHENVTICSDAEKVDQALMKIHDRVNKAHYQMQRLCDDMSGLNKIHSLLNEMSSRVNSLHELCIDTEKQLIELQNRVEEEELQQKQGQELSELLLAKCQQAQFIEKERIRLAREHAGRLAKQQEKIQNNLLERQATFQQEFEQDLKLYREKKSSLIQSTSSTTTTATGGENDLPSEIVSGSADEVLLLSPSVSVVTATLASPPTSFDHHDEMDIIASIVPDADPMLDEQLQHFLADDSDDLIANEQENQDDEEEEEEDDETEDSSSPEEVHVEKETGEEDAGEENVISS